MAKRFITFGSIEQFKSVIRNVNQITRYLGTNEDGEAVYDNDIKLPTIKFSISEKIHGCLKYDTLITTKEYGDIPIKLLVDEKPNCTVLTKNLNTGKDEWNKVLNVWNSIDNTKKWYKVILEDDTEIIMTGNHKVYNPDTNSYIKCEELKIGDIVLKRLKTKIKNIELLEETYELYDIETENHNFYANDILVHNSNAGFCYNNIDGYWFQSRKNIITPLKDNAGCAFMMEDKKDVWIDLIKRIANYNNIDLNKYGIALYSEIQGGNIQKVAACTGLEKSFIIFEYCKVFPINENAEKPEENTWFLTKDEQEFVDSPENKIYNIINLNADMIDINFGSEEALAEVQNELHKRIQAIEENSIVGEKLGKKGNVGEGFVLQAMVTDRLGREQLLRFKAKGMLHSNSKVKTVKLVDTKELKKINDFARDIACQGFRLDQMFSEIQNAEYNGDTSLMSMKDMGTYLKLIHQDVIKEHSTELAELNLEPKQVNSTISRIAKEYFKNRLEEI